MDLHNSTLTCSNKTCSVDTARWATIILRYKWSTWAVPCNWEPPQTTLCIRKCHSGQSDLTLIKSFSLETTFSLNMPLTHHISISALALTPNLNPGPLPCPLINEHAIDSTTGCHTPTQSPSSFPCQKPTPYKVRAVFSKPVHAVRVRSGSPGPNYGPFTAVA